MSGKKTRIDLEQLRLEIRILTPDQQLYAVLRDELSKIGHWKQKPRGNPVKAFNSRRKVR